MEKYQLRFKKSKEQFAKDMERQAKAYRKYVWLFENVVAPTLRQWNGKVINKRLANAIMANSGCAELSASVETNRYGTKELTISLKYGENWNDKHSMTFQVVPIEEGNCVYSNTLDAEKTLTKHPHQEWLKSYIKNAEVCENAIALYDVYAERAKKMQDAISDWVDLNYQFAQNVEFQGLWRLK